MIQYYFEDENYHKITPYNFNESYKTLTKFAESLGYKKENSYIDSSRQIKTFYNTDKTSFLVCWKA